MLNNDKNNLEQCKNREYQKIHEEFYARPLGDRLIIRGAFYLDRVKKNFTQWKNLFWVN